MSQCTPSRKVKKEIVQTLHWKTIKFKEMSKLEMVLAHINIKNMFQILISKWAKLYIVKWSG
jgi:hypothetical protein